MIHRKPRVGDQLRTIGNYTEVKNNGAIPKWEYAGVVVEVTGKLCYYQHPDRDKIDCFIWLFSNTPNVCFSILAYGHRLYRKSAAVS
jgi:hypothetical protein